MEKIKRFLECLVPVTVCNLKCSYCYIIQRESRTLELPKFEYPPEHIGKALSKKRLGGVSYISICGAGETLVPKEIPKIIEEILKQGHYVNITTNGTLTNKFEEIVKIDKELLKRLHFSFSFHYLELKRLNMLEQFFDNIKLIKNHGCSFIVQLNLCDDYNPYIDEIKNICMEKVGALPQIAATRKENKDKIELMTNLSKEEYEKIGQDFNSNLFTYTMKNFNKKRCEFCYAGQWSGVLNLANGKLMKCYGAPFTQNIYKNINKPIKFEAVGNNCYSSFCYNSSHFMSLGILGKDNDLEYTYASLRDRPEANWLNENTKEFFKGKLYDNNEEYSKLHKIYVDAKGKIERVAIFIKPKIKKLMRKR